MLIDAIVVFLIGLVLGGIGIYVGARAVTGTEDYFYAVGTAFIGAVAWALVSLFFGWIPGLGALIALIVWVGIINMRYPGGWSKAFLIGFIAWLTVLIVLSVLAGLGITSFDAIGVPT